MAGGTSNANDQKDSQWYFTAAQLANSPSRKHGIDTDQELSYRQQTAYLIQEMGQRLQVSQLCINTAIVYMHRFYAFHSFTHFHRNGIAAASLFLAAKVEEQPRKLEHVIKVAHLCLNQESPPPSSDIYTEQAQDLVFNENVLLQTLGFDVAIDHPHTHVVRTCHLVKACKDLAQTSYFLASNSLHLTPMCLQYRPTVVACFCIYLACKWSRWEIPQSTEGKHWFHYVDKSVTTDLLKQLTDEFLAIYEKSPARLKSKLNSIKALAQGARISEPSRPIPESSNGSSSQQIQLEPARRPEWYSSHHRSHHSSSTSTHSGSSHHHHGGPSTGSEMIEYLSAKESSSHKQPHMNAHTSRSRQDRPQLQSNDPQYSHSTHSSKHQLSSGSLRTSNVNRPAHIPGNTPQQIPTQRSHQQDLNHHKTRMPQAAHMNVPTIGHKSMPKIIDSQRMTKETVRGMEPPKIPTKHSNATLHPIQNLSSNSNNSGVDMTRNILQQASVGIQPRAYLQTNTSQPTNFSQSLVTPSRNLINPKFDSSVQQTYLNQRQIESSVDSTINKQIDENCKIKDTLDSSSPTKYSYTQIQQSSIPTKSTSIFSPEWNDKPVSEVGLYNSTENVIMNNKTNLGFHIKGTRESPKKLEREKRSETPKKEKNRNDLLQSDQKIIQTDKNFGNNKNMIESNQLFETKVQQNTFNISNLKRPFINSDNDIKHEDSYERDLKIRKMETKSPSNQIDQKPPILPYLHEVISNDSRSFKTFPTTINGIETNPDLVSSLLKESLCNDKFSANPIMKTETVSSEELKTVKGLDNLTVEPPNVKLISDIPLKLETILPIEEIQKTKSEKKKKKEKHKHKDKDKTKDKEEKKKHKKDKDKHKDRERNTGQQLEQNPVKLKISKEKYNISLVELPNPAATGFKIKIPKDKIKGELASYQFDDNVPNVTVPSTNSLKIKISKDKIENYPIPQHNIVAHSNIGNISHSHSSSSSSSKKKDRERDKKKNSNDHNKHNGNNNNSSGASGTTSNKSSTKMQSFNHSINQLFGESNDEETFSPPQKIQYGNLRYQYSENNR